MTYTALPVSKINGSVLTDIPLTAFGELKVSEMTPIATHTFEYSVDNSLITTNTTTGTGAITQGDAMAIVQTGTTTGNTAKLISTKKIKYKSGMGLCSRFSARFQTASATTALVGLADEAGSTAPFKNGLMIGTINSGVFGVHRLSNDTANSVLQSSWDDPLDGSGRSGMTIDWTKLNVFEIQTQWLGSGQMVFKVEDADTGLFVPFHTIKYANLNTAPSTFNPNYHHTIYVDNLATTSDIIIRSASFAFFVEGREKLPQIHQPLFNTDNRSKTGITTETCLFTLRNKSTYNSYTNFIDIIPHLITASVIQAGGGSSTNLATIRITKNATLGGVPSYSSISATNSVMEIDVSATTRTNGQILFSLPLIGNNDKFIVDLSKYHFVLQPTETLTISAESSVSSDFNATMMWEELI